MLLNSLFEDTPFELQTTKHFPAIVAQLYLGQQNGHPATVRDPLLQNPSFLKWRQDNPVAYKQFEFYSGLTGMGPEHAKLLDRAFPLYIAYGIPLNIDNLLASETDFYRIIQYKPYQQMFELLAQKGLLTTTKPYTSQGHHSLTEWLDTLPVTIERTNDSYSLLPLELQGKPIYAKPTINNLLFANYLNEPQWWESSENRTYMIERLQRMKSEDAIRLKAAKYVSALLELYNPDLPETAVRQLVLVLQENNLRSQELRTITMVHLENIAKVSSVAYRQLLMRTAVSVFSEPEGPHTFYGKMLQALLHHDKHPGLPIFTAEQHCLANRTVRNMGFTVQWICHYLGDAGVQELSDFCNFKGITDTDNPNYTPEFAAAVDAFLGSHPKLAQINAPVDPGSLQLDA